MVVATRRATSPSWSEGSTVSVSTSTSAKKRVVFAPGTLLGKTDTKKIGTAKKAWRRRNFPKPPKKITKGTSHIHFHKKVSNKKGASNVENDAPVQRIKMLTGTLYIYKGRKAEFVRSK